MTGGVEMGMGCSTTGAEMTKGAEMGMGCSTVNMWVGNTVALHGLDSSKRGEFRFYTGGLRWPTSLGLQSVMDVERELLKTASVLPHLSYKVGSSVRFEDEL